MQLNSEFSINRYIIGTILNLNIAFFMFEPHELVTVAIFFLTVLANQYCLYILVLGMLGYIKTKFRIPVPFYGFFKLVVIIFGFYYAMGKLDNKLLFLVFIYIFQLIILVLSNKRVIKKN